MGDGIKAYYEDLQDQADQKWQSESKQIISDIDPGLLRQEIKDLLNILEKTPQTRWMWSRLDELRKLLKI
jgi:hypothetical protein